MHRPKAPKIPVLILSLLLAGASAAQGGAQPAEPQPEPRPPAIEQKAEQIRHEDAGSRIDELRVGGQTRRIDVDTKSSLPAYQVQPIDQGAPSQAGGGAGKSSWHLLKF